MKGSFLDCRTTACWNFPPVTGDMPSETTFTLFSNHSATHDGKEVRKEFWENLSIYKYAAIRDMPSITSPGKVTGKTWRVCWLGLLVYC